ncbi:DnaD domain-containing protein [Thermanaerothrix daxensis]|nr:DnaD domain protein [Thermanaerothrix daxensis]
MASFAGFPAGKVGMTRIPNPFFTDLLPEIDHLGELKVTLYAFWFLEHLEGTIRYLSYEDFAGDRRLLEGLGEDDERAREALREALERAVQRGTFLQVRYKDRERETTLYFLNTPRGRAAVEALQRGEWQPEHLSHPEVALDLERPNIFRLYEQNIGPLTPMLAEALRDAERTYPMAWIEEAIRIAVENNVRRWRYVEAILRARMEREGYGANRRDAETNRRKYIEGEYGQYVQH